MMKVEPLAAPVSFVKMDQSIEGSDKGEGMNYSLLNVYCEKDGYVDGVWIEDCNGISLEAAIIRAKSTQRALENKIVVAVVESLNCPTPNYCYRTGLKRLG